MSTFALYRFFDPEDQLLYVGLTVNPGRRMEKHRGCQPWWNDVARIEFEQHPDHETLKAAEREAIKTEGPLYNERMNGKTYQRPRIEWLCDVCRRPIPDDDGYITVSYADVEARRKWRRKFDERQRQKAAAAGTTWITYSLTELNGCPDRAQWHVLHRRCDPQPKSNDYWIGTERIRTLGHVLSWSAHLTETKKWLPDTTWPSLLRRLISSEDMAL